jgi:hypothetical protein
VLRVKHRVNVRIKISAMKMILSGLAILFPPVIVGAADMPVQNTRVTMSFDPGRRFLKAGAPPGNITLTASAAGLTSSSVSTTISKAPAP